MDAMDRLQMQLVASHPLPLECRIPITIPAKRVLLGAALVISTFSVGHHGGFSDIIGGYGEPVPLLDKLSREEFGIL